WVINGEPTDGSLVTLAEKANVPLSNLNPIDKIPFDSEYKYIAVLAEYHDEKYIFIKGAPDRVFEMVEFEETRDNLFKREIWEERIHQLAKKGERVLGAAYKRVPN